MDLDIIHLWSTMNNLVRGVAIVLTVQALLCLMVVVDRLILLAISGRRSKAFARQAGKLLKDGKHDDVIALAKDKKNSTAYLAKIIEAGLSVFKARSDDGHSPEKAAEHARRAVERRGEQLSESLNRGMNVLASTGSTAPFVGLLGTVLGILNAFKLISSEGGGGMSTIGAAIGEALIVTGYGLMVAIPSVLIFNYLSGRIAKYEAALDNAGSELIDTLEVEAFSQLERPGVVTSERAPTSTTARSAKQNGIEMTEKKNANNKSPNLNGDIERPTHAALA
ncbi:MAG: biopolymer transport protein ExbB/TolQ [Polyangiales bacterium]|jgi:biopolymer transport protein ExbB/TolQ